jgi:gamma-glutamylcyclotransferase (GGCT)/AIG2-like uncharacterized protein YtfP
MTMTNTKVAVYGSLRQGMGNHRLLEGQKFVGTTVTEQPYAMYSLGGFPKVSLEGAKVCPIVVEIYDVDAQGLSRLNQLEGFHGKGSQYNFYDCSPVATGLGEALIYHIEDGYGGTRECVDHGDWVKYRKGE